MSSYLLTEIALEMLGYQFYDVDGNPGPTNFHNTQLVPNEQNNGTAAETLDNFLGLYENTNDSHNSALSDEHTEEGNMTSALSNEHTEEGSALPADIQSNWPSVRIKLLDAECAKVRRQLEQEIFRSKAVLKQNYHPLSPCDDNTSEEIQKLIYEKKLKLVKDKETVKNFRKVAEKKISKINREQNSKP